MLEKKSASALLSYAPSKTLKASFRRHMTKRPHIDLIVGDPSGKWCADFYTTSRNGTSIESLTQKGREYVRDGGLHPCDMLDLPIGHEETIPEGAYGSGAWSVIASGRAKRNDEKKAFVLAIDDPSSRKGTRCQLYSPFPSGETWILNCQKRKRNS